MSFSTLKKLNQHLPLFYDEFGDVDHKHVHTDYSETVLKQKLDKIAESRGSQRSISSYSEFSGLHQP